MVDGFHDIANAVATVLDTHELRPGTTVVLSWVCNALGVLAGGTVAACNIVHLLPVEILVSAESDAGLAMVLSLLAETMLWNVDTRYLGLPSCRSQLPMEICSRED